MNWLTRYRTRQIKKNRYKKHLSELATLAEDAQQLMAPEEKEFYINLGKVECDMIQTESMDETMNSYMHVNYGGIKQISEGTLDFTQLSDLSQAERNQIRKYLAHGYSRHYMPTIVKEMLDDGRLECDFL